DFKGVARLIEKETGIPVIPVATDGLKSYVSGVGLAIREWIRRFGDRTLLPDDSVDRMEQLRKYGVNLLGVTPIDFSSMENVNALKRSFTDAGIPVNTCFAMGDSFENLTKVYCGAVNVAVSSAGRIPARYLAGTAGIPWVEGLPMGETMTRRLIAAVRQAAEGGAPRRAAEDADPASEGVPGGNDAFPEAEAQGKQDTVLVIGEELWARTLAGALHAGELCRRHGLFTKALWPDVDEGLDEDLLIAQVNAARAVIGDPLFRVVLRNRDTAFIPFPHEGYSGRIFRKDIPVFASPEYDPEALLAKIFP
ncbi:MAG: hypothetical protein K6E83_09150, partial [Clostridium sp.]|nr:hypothetical protein [Clostridium sp.]